MTRNLHTSAHRPNSLFLQHPSTTEVSITVKNLQSIYLCHFHHRLSK